MGLKIFEEETLLKTDTIPDLTHVVLNIQLRDRES